MSIFAPLVARAQTVPDATFCTFCKRDETTRITVANAVSRAADYACHLRALSLGAGDIVIIVLPHSADLYYSFIGCVLAGVTPSFMPPLTRKQDPVIFARSMQALFARISPAAVIADAETLGLIEETRVPVVLTTDVPRHPCDLATLRREAEAVDDDAIAFLQHSSGTTGLKKGVMLSHRAVHEQAAAYARSIGLEQGDVVVSWLPLYHDMGLFTSFVIPAIVGAPIVSLDALEWVMRPTLLLDAITRHAGAFAWLPNFAFHHIARLDMGEERWDFSSLKALVSCSEPCRAPAFATFLERYAPQGLRPDQLSVSYALAENAFAVTQTAIGAPVATGRGPLTGGFLSCGRPLTGVTVEIRPHADQGPDGAGEIWVTGPSLFDGYFRQPDLTRQKLVDGWYRTGDIGLMEGEDLFVIGRTDDLLIVNGRNLLAHEIEDLVSRIDGVAPGRVLAYAAHDDEAGATGLVVLVEPTGDPTARALVSIVRQAVFSHCGIQPNAVHVLARGFLLKTTSGKIARAASVEKFAAGFLPYVVSERPAMAS